MRILMILTIIILICTALGIVVCLQQSSPPKIVGDTIHFKGETYPKEVPFAVGMTLKPGQETTIVFPHDRKHQIIAEGEYK